MPMYRNKQLSPLAKLRLVLGSAVALVLIGTLGFGMLEDMGPLEALYMTIITISTVGFSEVRPLHGAGRIFVMFLIRKRRWDGLVYSFNSRANCYRRTTS
ncbi:MAG: two pore domain potassium channel family protein [candidate division Zixibacteria bacterium]|nr:two pore domain potassium channel family protein [candidate division Zixibacteria bacterium]